MALTTPPAARAAASDTAASDTAAPGTAATGTARPRALAALRAWRPSDRWVRGFAWAAVLSNALIAVTGVIVRVTGSGLGCSTWPDCQPGTLVPESRSGMAAIHQAIEFGNRTITGIVLVASLGAFLLIWRALPHRRGLVAIAAIGPVGVLFQAVWGGVLVHLDLAWWSVTPHLLASLVLVYAATVVLCRLREDDGIPQPVVPQPLRAASWLTVVVLGAVTVVGALVTATGPHAGDAKTPRLGWDLRNVAQAHADLMFLYLGLIAAMGIGFLAVHAPRRLLVRTGWLIGLTIAQGALGLVQYFLEVPAVLVVLHVLGAVTLIAVAASVVMATRTRSVTALPEVQSPAHQTH